MGLNVKGGPHGEGFLSGHTVLEDCPLDWISSRQEDWSLVYAVGGSGSIGIVGGGEFQVEPGSAIIVSPGIRHHFSACSGNWDILWFHFVMRPHMDGIPAWNSALDGFQKILVPESSRPVIEGTLREILDLDMAHCAGWLSLAYNLIENVIIRCGGFSNEGRSVMDSRLRKALDLLHANRNGQWPVSDLAAACGLSRSALFALFRRQVGSSPHEYFETLKIERSKHLLARSSLLIGEIAAEVGFPSIYYFSSRFTKAVGCSPRSYRAKLPSKDFLP